MYLKNMGNEMNVMNFNGDSEPLKKKPKTIISIKVADT